MVTEQTCFHDTFDAIIGLAYPEFAEEGVTPLFDAMMNAGILGQNLFAFHMSMNPEDEESEVMFGAWNPDRIDTRGDHAEVEWHPVVHKLFWSVKLDDVRIGDVSLGLCGDDTDPCRFTPDTGTSLLTFPSWAKKQFKKDHPNWENGEDCTSEFAYGDLTYVINGIDYTIPANHWMERTVNENSSTCKHTIGTLDVGQNGLNKLFIGGDSFMQLYYTIFNRDESDTDFPMGSVGFAASKHTAPEVITHWDIEGNYANTEYICEPYGLTA